MRALGLIRHVAGLWEYPYIVESINLTVQALVLNMMATICSPSANSANPELASFHRFNFLPQSVCPCTIGAG